MNDIASRLNDNNPSRVVISDYDADILIKFIDSERTKHSNLKLLGDVLSSIKTDIETHKNKSESALLLDLGIGKKDDAPFLKYE